MTRSFASMLHLTHPSSGTSSIQPFRLPHCLILRHVGTRVLPPVVVHFCSICREVDHTAASCALAYLQQPSSTVSTQPTRQGSKQQAVASHTLCISWNRGRCLFPKSCSFRHVCSSCFQQHPAVECPSKWKRDHLLQELAQTLGLGYHPVTSTFPFPPPFLLFPTMFIVEVPLLDFLAIMMVV